MAKRNRHTSYGVVPTVRYNRSQFNLSHGITTSFSVGDLIPIDWQEVLPGDSFKVRAVDVSRVTSSFIKPVMDNLYLYTYHFFVPLRQVYDNAKEVFGVSKPSSYTDNERATFPTTKGNVGQGTLADYLGLPIGVRFDNDDAGVSLLPFRAYAWIYENWFRNENVVDEVFVQKGNFASTELLNLSDASPNNYTGKPFKVAKIKDYFTSCIPQPQKGPEVLLPLGSSAPVLTSDDVADSRVTPPPLRLALSSHAPFTGQLLGIGSTGGNVPGSGRFLISTSNAATESSPSLIVPRNLWADLSQATAASINDQRMAFALQRMLEKDATYGTRYNEYVYGHFGVSTDDLQIQIPEYLGGSCCPLNIIQTVQTSQATEQSPLGNVGAYSWSNGKSRYIKSFKEHGIVMTLCALRYHHTYQQGIAKKWTRFKREDFYDPTFANIGYQPVYKDELFADGTLTSLRKDVFGYNEAWLEYRVIPNIITGQMRSKATNSLDVWHFADNYSSAPTLSQSFIEETPKYVDRTLTVDSDKQNQFMFNFWFDMRAVRVMPTYSMPGFIDHH